MFEEFFSLSLFSSSVRKNWGSYQSIVGYVHERREKDFKRETVEYRNLSFFLVCLMKSVFKESGGNHSRPKTMAVPVKATRVLFGQG